MVRKTPSNHGKPITPQVVKQVKELAKGNTPTDLLAYKVGRTPASVRKIAQENNITLKPVNQSPYNRLPKKPS